jgi:hypothetical protein
MDSAEPRTRFERLRANLGFKPKASCE